MKKNGFTLVELLSVIIILGIVITIATTSVASLRVSIDQRAFQNKIVDILAVAKQWGSDNRTYLTQSVNVRGQSRKGYKINVQKLIDNDYLSTDEVKDGKKVVTNNANDKVINELEIIVYMESQRVYACIVENSNLLSDSAIDEYGEKGNYCYNF